MEQDPKAAVDCYRQAAEAGIAGAQYRLGQLYELGRGVEQDCRRAVHWYRQAAMQGHAEAQYELGSCYTFGDGVAQNYEHAAYWYRQAAKRGGAVLAGLGLHNGRGREEKLQAISSVVQASRQAGTRKRPGSTQSTPSPENMTVRAQYIELRPGTAENTLLRPCVAIRAPEHR